MSNPGFFFYTGDWLKDTRALSLEARGAWIDLLCILHEHGGQITWAMTDLSRFLAVDVPRASEFVRDLSRLNTADVTFESQGTVTIACRKMLREKTTRENAKIRKQRERDRKRDHRVGHNAVTPKSTASSSSESSSSSSSYKNKMQDPTSSEPSAHYLKSDISDTVKKTVLLATGVAIAAAEGDNTAKRTIAARELNPLIKDVADRIYRSDRQKFERLVSWIKKAQKLNYPDVTIAAALRRFEPYAGRLKNDWWGYLDNLVKKADMDLNASETAKQSKAYKDELWQIGSILKDMCG